MNRSVCVFIFSFITQKEVKRDNSFRGCWWVVGGWIWNGNFPHNNSHNWNSWSCFCVAAFNTWPKMIILKKYRDSIKFASLVTKNLYDQLILYLVFHYYRGKLISQSKYRKSCLNIKRPHFSEKSKYQLKFQWLLITATFLLDIIFSLSPNYNSSIN